MSIEKLPERYEGQITQDEYDLIVNQSLKFLTEKGTIEKVEDGVIYVDLNDTSDDVNQLALDNLLRNCKQEDDTSKWQEIINDHFTRLTSKVDFDKSDFNKCRDLLAIRIYPEYDENTKAVMTFKTDFPGTMSTLVLDLSDKYESIDKETIEAWRVPVDSLFYFAQENVNKRDSIEILETKEGEGNKIYSFFSVDNSASYIRDIEANADFAIGEFGAFVAIPTRGSAFILPINDRSAVKVLSKLKVTAKKFFDEDPGNITADIYWYNNGAFQIVSFIGGKPSLPKELETIL